MIGNAAGEQSIPSKERAMSACIDNNALTAFQNFTSTRCFDDDDDDGGGGDGGDGDNRTYPN